VRRVLPADAILIPDNAKRVFQGKIYDVYQWPQTLFDGSVATFEMLKRPDTVIVIGIVDNHILLLDDEQPHRGSRMSLPGGRVEPNEATLAAAQREVHEETGYTFKHWSLVRVWQPETKIEWFVYLYVAWDVLAREDPHVDAGERIAVRLETYEQVRRLASGDDSPLEEAHTLFEHATSPGALVALAEQHNMEITK
jgi:8-oxo-dGTP pyrophosphatase MutT (NUDIX family)